MFSALIVTFRETLEAALIIGIILAYLNKTLNSKHKKMVWYGVAGGVAVSIVMAFVFQNYLGGFEGRAEEIYEGVTMIVAAGLITWMILWMLKQRHGLKQNLENKVQTHVGKNYYWGIALLAFVSVAREGIETVIFLQAAVIQSNEVSVFWGALLGIVFAILASFALFKGIVNFPLRKFFTVTSVILILFAAGLLAHGVHEFEDAKVLSPIVEHVWDINDVINEKGTVGEILKGLFGYNGNPSLLEVMSYVIYLIVIALVWRVVGRKKVAS